jgi:hypothetical protein
LGGKQNLEMPPKYLLFGSVVVVVVVVDNRGPNWQRLMDGFSSSFSFADADALASPRMMMLCLTLFAESYQLPVL